MNGIAAAHRDPEAYSQPTIYSTDFTISSITFFA
ncbi:hypothetical protein BH160DRAFT_7259, partial [Burkholderia sp. H160]